MASVYAIGLFAAAVMSFHSSEAQWDHNYLQPHLKHCPYKRSFWAMQSKFSSSFHDRKYTFLCRYNGQARVCDVNWRTPIPANNLESWFFFVCAKGYLSAIRSSFNFLKKDRSFRFKCCRSGTIQKPFNCKWTPFLNNFGEYFKFIAPSSPHYYLTGIWSVFSTTKKDRRFRFKYCQAELPRAAPPGK